MRATDPRLSDQTKLYPHNPSYPSKTKKPPQKLYERTNESSQQLTVCGIPYDQPAALGGCVLGDLLKSVLLLCGGFLWHGERY